MSDTGSLIDLTALPSPQFWRATSFEKDQLPCRVIAGHVETGKLWSSIVLLPIAPHVILERELEGFLKKYDLPVLAPSYGEKLREENVIPNRLLPSGTVILFCGKIYRGVEEGRYVMGLTRPSSELIWSHLRLDGRGRDQGSSEYSYLVALHADELAKLYPDVNEIPWV